MMFRSWSNRKDLFSNNDGCEAPRPCTTGQLKGRSSISSLPSSSYTAHSRGNVSVPSQYSSISSRTTFSSKTSYGSVNLEVVSIPTLTKTPWELERHKKRSIHQRRNSKSMISAHFFQELPKGVYDCILQQLELLHFDGGTQICPSCYLKDLHSLSLTNRAWDKAATRQLYGKVWLLIESSHTKMQKLKYKATGRLKLLRRTLRERTTLARYVKELHMPDFQYLYLYQKAWTEAEQEEIVNMVASIVMACPNLERLSGFHITYTHTFDRLSHALASRRNLRERIWTMAGPNSLYTLTKSSEDDEHDPNDIYYQRINDPTERFLDLNSNHPNLETLVLDSATQSRDYNLSFRGLLGTVRSFPSLTHLSLSHLPTDSFTTRHLLFLPPRLISLRLENLPGITDRGLSRFASSLMTARIENLSLVDLKITSLLTLSKFLSADFPSLKRFTIAQSRCLDPSLGAGLTVPVFKSGTLEYLHWDISRPGSINKDLARSINAGALPSLRRLRALHDYDGLLQSICKPMVSVTLPSDYTLLNATYEISTLQPLIGHSERKDSFIMDEMEVEIGEERICRLRKARLEAQQRIFDARKKPSMLIRITNPEGVVVHRKTLYGYMGAVTSKIEYDLSPNIEGSDTALTTVEDITGGRNPTWEDGQRPPGCGHFGRVRRKETDLKLLF